MRSRVAPRAHSTTRSLKRPTGIFFNATTPRSAALQPGTIGGNLNLLVLEHHHPTSSQKFESYHLWCKMCTYNKLRYVWFLLNFNGFLKISPQLFRNFSKWWPNVYSSSYRINYQATVGWSAYLAGQNLKNESRCILTKLLSPSSTMFGAREFTLHPGYNMSLASWLCYDSRVGVVEYYQSSIVKQRSHRNANRMRTWHAKTMGTFDVDVFLRRGQQHSAVWRMFGEQPNAIRRLSVHQREFTYNMFM